MNRIVYVLLVGLAGVPSADAYETNAASAAYADVLATYGASPAGTIIHIPPGNVTWTNALSVTKEIHLVGAGSGAWTWDGTNSALLPAPQQTIITISGQVLNFSAAASDSSVGCLVITNSSSATDSLTINVQASRFQFYSNWVFGVSTKVLGVQVSGGTPTSFLQPSSVVMWKNFMYNARVYVRGDLSSAFGAYEWARGYSFGTTNTCFIEDNFFQLTLDVGQNMIDWDAGGHAVVRFNTVVDATLQTHGNNGSIRGTLATEIYGNTIAQVNLTKNEGAIRLRGGANIVFSNTVSGTFNPTFLELDDPNGLGGIPPISTKHGNQTNALAAHDGTGNASVFVDSSQSWTSNQWANYVCWNLADGSAGLIASNTATQLYVTMSGGTENDFDPGDPIKISDSYPLRDQIGFGRDIAIGAAPNYTNQVAQLNYEWSNTYNGANWDFGVANGAGRWIVDGREYTNDTVMPDYTPAQYPNPLRGMYEAAAPPPVVMIPTHLRLRVR